MLPAPVRTWVLAASVRSPLSAAFSASSVCSDSAFDADRSAPDASRMDHAVSRVPSAKRLCVRPESASAPSTMVWLLVVSRPKPSLNVPLTFRSPAARTVSDAASVPPE